jgi:hypothetical protein
VSEGFFPTTGAFYFSLRLMSISKLMQVMYELMSILRMYVRETEELSCITGLSLFLAYMPIEHREPLLALAPAPSPTFNSKSMPQQRTLTRLHICLFALPE